MTASDWVPALLTPLLSLIRLSCVAANYDIAWKLIYFSFVSSVPHNVWSYSWLDVFRESHIASAIESGSGKCFSKRAPPSNHPSQRPRNISKRVGYLRPSSSTNICLLVLCFGRHRQYAWVWGSTYPIPTTIAHATSSFLPEPKDYCMVTNSEQWKYCSLGGMACWFVLRIFVVEIRAGMYRARDCQHYSIFLLLTYRHAVRNADAHSRIEYFKHFT